MQILTALSNIKLYEKIRNNKDLNLYKKDIQYREGILEVLKNNNKIKVIIIYEKLPGEIDFKDLIEEIKFIDSEIKIVFLLENKNEELEKILVQKNIKNIFYNSEINFNDFILKIKQINFSEEELLKKEITKLNKIIFEKNEEIRKYKEKKFEENVINKDFSEIRKEEKKNRNKITRFLVISDISYDEYKIIKKEICRKMEKKKVFSDEAIIKYIDFNNLNFKFVKRNYVKIIFLVKNNFDEIRKINIFLKENFLVNNKKINILILKNKNSFYENNNSVNYSLLKSVFRNYNFLGKIKIDKSYSSQA